MHALIRTTTHTLDLTRVRAPPIVPITLLTPGTLRRFIRPASASAMVDRYLRHWAVR